MHRMASVLIFVSLSLGMAVSLFAQDPASATWALNSTTTVTAVASGSGLG